MVLQKPKIGEYYKVQHLTIRENDYIIKVTAIEGNYAYYSYLNSEHIHTWNFVSFPEVIHQKLSPLEVELL